MGSKPNLQSVLETVMGTRNVYFDPPESIKMNYPAIRYSLSNILTISANNSPYSNAKGYMLTLIDYEPDSEFVDKLLTLPLCRFDRHYVADNLHHYIFTLFY